jgi:hypothetical protein
MSEQPQEWRQEDCSVWEGDVFIGRANTAFQAKHFVDAHNAALANAKLTAGEFGRHLTELMSKYEKELATEREELRTTNQQLTEQLDAEREKVAELECWKKSAIAVMPPIQEIGRELDLKLGESIHDKILPGIQELKRQLATKQENTFNAQQAALKEGIRSGEIEQQLATEREISKRFEIQVDDAQRQLTIERKKRQEVETQLEAWQRSFGTTQLTHALAKIVKQ